MTAEGRGNGRRSLTRLGLWLVAIASAITSIGFLRGDVWMYLVALLALATVVVSWVAVPRLPHLESTLVIPTYEVVGQGTPTRLVLRSPARRSPRHRLTLTAPGDADPVELVIEPLAAGETRTIDLDLHPAARGVFRERRTTHWTAAPFGLVRRTHTDLSAMTRAIAAGIDDHARVAPGSQPGDGESGRMTVGRSGPDVHALRSWSSGDGTRIHWRTTVRRGSPVVVDRESYERTSLLVVAGPSHPTPEAADAVIARVAGIASRAARDGAEVRLVSSRGADQLLASELEALLPWTVIAEPTSGTSAADHAAAALRPGARVAIVTSDGLTGGAWVAEAARFDVEVVEVEVAPRPSVPRRKPSVPTFSRALAVATMGSLGAGVLCLTAAGVLGSAAAAGWLLALGAGAGLGLLRPATFVDVRLRTLVSIGIIAVNGLLAFRSADDGDLALAGATAVCGVALAQLVSSRTRRDALVALGLGPVMVIAAAGFAPTPALVLPTVLTAIAVLLGLGAAARDSLVDDTLPATPTATANSAAGSLLVPVSAAVLLGVVAYLVLPLGSAPTLSGSLLGDSPVSQQSAAERAAQVTPAYFNGSLDLSARGHLPETPAFDVPAGTDGLWRAMTLSQVTNGTWFSMPAQATYTADSSGRITLPTDPAEDGAPTAAVRDYLVRPIGAWNVIAPGPATTVSGLSSVAQVTSDAYSLDASVAPFTVAATARTDVDSLTRAGGGADRSESEWVQLDPSTTQRTVDLARSIVGTTTDRVAMVRAVESWLRANVRYQLDAPLPPNDQNAVDFLLFESHAGFCEHFAAAETILLRSIGVPSRMATGYVASSQNSEASGRITIRASDAHAWVEVWIPGHGWVSSDPTAGSALAAAADQSLVQKLLAGWNRLWSSDSGRRTLAIGLVLLAFVAGAIAFPLRRRRAVAVRRDAEARGVSLEPLAAFARYRAALCADGHQLGPGDGVAEVRRLVTEPALLTALVIVERTLYASTLPPGHVRVATAELLDRRTAALTARRQPIPTR